MPSKYYAIDGGTGLIKRERAQAAITATAFIGTQWDQGAAVGSDLACIINVEAIDVAASSLYTFSVVGSNLTNRSDGQILGRAILGNLAAMATPETVVSAVGDQIIIEFRSEKKETLFRYIDLHLIVAGGTATITFNAFIARRN